MNTAPKIPTINLMGIPLSVLSRQALLKVVEGFLSSEKGGFYAVTPNPEIILGALRDEELFYILNKADLSPADGIGLKFAALAMGHRLPRVAGADLTQDLLRLAEIKGCKVGILNWKGGLSKEKDIRASLKKLYPNLVFVVEDIEREWRMPFYKKINGLEPELLFVALGSPWQEKFIFHALAKMPYVKLAAGVGGSFDFLTGKVARSPGFMRFLGLEWAWRFFQQGKGTRAWRLRRICRAVCVFPAYFLKWQFINPFLYRKNVACLVYRKITSGKDNQAPGFQVLILERKQEPGHWQLPQGGRDGEDIMTAGLRELGEELNCRKIRPVAAFANVYRYKFGQRKHEDTDRKQRVYQHYHYKGQRQGLLVAEFIGDSDEDISVNYWEYQNWKWVEPGQLLKEVHPIRQKATEIFMQKFQKVVNDPRYKL